MTHTTGTNEQHVYHHSDSEGLRVNLSVEKNSKSIKYSITVVGGKSVDEALAALKEGEAKLKALYGENDVTVSP